MLDEGDKVVLPDHELADPLITEGVSPVGGPVEEGHPESPQSHGAQSPEHLLFRQRRLLLPRLVEVPGHAVDDAAPVARRRELSLHVPGIKGGFAPV